MKLGDVAKLVMGQSPASSSYNSDGNGLPFYQGNADFGKKHPTPKSWCTEPKKIAEAGDILLSVRAPVGAINIANEKCCIGRGLAAIRTNFHGISCGFLALVLQSRLAYLEAVSTGSTFKSIGRQALAACEVPLYPFEIQGQIVLQFNGIDSCLHNARVRLALLDALVKSRFVEMFGDPLEVTTGRILSSIALLKAGKFTAAAAIVDKQAEGLYPCYGGNGLRGYTNTYTHEGTFPLIGRQGALCGNVKLAHGKFRATEHAVVVQPSAGISPIWLFHYLAYDKLERLATGAAQPGLSVKQLGKVPVPLPPLPLQQEFADFVAQVDKSRFVLSRNLRILN